MRFEILRATVGGAALALALTACHGSSSSNPDAVPVDFRHNPSGQGTKAVTFGNDSITTEELHRRFAEMATLGRARFQAASERKAFAENLARFELLAQEAAREGLAQDPDVLEAAKRMMVNKLLQKKRGPPGPVSDAEVQTYYQAHLTDFVRPETLRLFMIFLDAPKGSAGRAAAQKKADALYAEAKAQSPADFSAFGKLAKDNSQDNKTQVLNGDTSLRSVADLQKDYGQEVVTAAQALQHQGEVAPVVATDRGFYLLKLNSRIPALDRNLSTPGVKEQIGQRVAYDKTQQATEEYVAELKKKEHFRVDDAAIASIQVDPTAAPLPSTTHSGPRMMMSPNGGNPFGGRTPGAAMPGGPLLPGAARPVGTGTPTPLLVPPAPGGSHP